MIDEPRQTLRDLLFLLQTTPDLQISAPHLEFPIDCEHRAYATILNLNGNAYEVSLTPTSPPLRQEVNQQ